MSKRPTLHDFVDEELLRAPLAYDQVVDAVQTQWQLAPPIALRGDADAARVLTRHRRDLVADAVNELRTQVLAEVGRATRERAVGGGRPPGRELSLIDEDEVAADIEVTRSIERIKQAAEFELRELQAFTSGLVDDVNVARDTNPFRPDAYVRSLWRGVFGLPIPRALQAAFMRDAAEPLARVLRQGYAAACTRLEDQGVEPATHRTIVLGLSTRNGTELEAAAAGNLVGLRDSMPMPLDATATHRPKESVSAATVPKVDQQLIELLSRLFDAIHDDTQLAAPTVSLLLRLQPSALRVALRDPAMLEAYEHPVWRFMDALAFMLEAAATTDRDRCLAHCRGLVDLLVGDRTANAARFDWAVLRLAEFDRLLLERDIAAAQPTIARLRAAADSASMPIDVGTLDTVPSELLPDTEPARPRTPTSLDLAPGARIRAYLHGDWRVLWVQWCDAGADVWLLRDTGSGEHWALHRRAIDRLAAERLASLMRPRSLIRAAAERVLRSMDAPGAEPL